MELVRPKYKPILLIIGLIWIFKMVEKTLLNISITRLTSTGVEYDLRNVVVVVSLHQAIRDISTVVFTYTVGVCTHRLGRYLMVVFPTTAFTIGLVLSFLVPGSMGLWFFFPAMVVMALAQAALTVTLKAFLDDQFRPKYDDDERKLHTESLWTCVSFLAAVFALFEPSMGLHLKKLELLLFILMGFIFLLFLLGFNCYYDDEGRSFNFKLPATSATTVKYPVNLKLFCSLPILSLVSASGSTFFLLEANTLVRGNLTYILMLDNVTRFMEFVVREASKRVVKKLKDRQKHPHNLQKMEMVRIAFAVCCCPLCCNIAVMTATHRKYETAGTMSVFWLTPQFFLLGLMAGLAKDGFRSLYESQVEPHQLKKYGSALGDLGSGVGSLLNILCIVIFGWHFNWFQNNIADSSLNMYYILLSNLSVTHVIIYLPAVLQYIGPSLFLLSDEKLEVKLLMLKEQGENSCQLGTEKVLEC
ncbi:hypothetical protein SASPL_106893 [Salvia splendens]|uniref:Uncharacterized protein n=1 Tax=Salvia splendens TaxID=180675 RepID=A0A8X8YC05_SALSN|nr:uncharacterized protein LOC121794174 isoform X1 [Salvia splendens]XP_042048158.1 uncharacterized protein LOC121794174 isoform X1 [Salvia splendens]KAG6428854.1 hypothetical protein SASPL_106893 [Salvia splendens]